MSFADSFYHAWTTAMHFCTVPNQKTWTVYGLFKIKLSNFFSLAFSVGKRDSPSTFMNTLHWLPMRERIKFKICMYIFKCLQGSAPEYLTDSLSHKLKPTTGPLTRSSADPDTSLLIAHVGKHHIGDKSFHVSAPSLWNGLPRNIREACTLYSFKKVLKSHLYPSYWL